MERTLHRGEFLPRTLRYTLLGMVLFTALYFFSIHSYPLFHAGAELYSIVVSIAIFSIVQATRHQEQPGFYSIIAAALFFSAIMDTVHMITYSGMNILQVSPNIPTQLWIASRLMDAVAFVAATFYISRPVRFGSMLTLFSLSFAALFASILTGIFPDCFVPGSGLTPFKKGMEYVIIILFTFAAYRQKQHEQHFDADVSRWLLLSLLTTICAEFMFTLYISTFGFSNMVGHILKVQSYIFLYLALVQSTVQKPLTTMFRSLKEREQELSEHKNRLEEIVAERTSELSATNEKLHKEIMRKNEAVKDMQSAFALLEGIVDVAPDRYFLVNSSGTIFPYTALYPHGRKTVVGNTDLPPSAAAAIRQLSTRYFNAGNEGDIEVWGENGQCYDIHLLHLPECEHHESLAVIAVRTVTERKEREEKMRRLSISLAELNNNLQERIEHEVAIRSRQEEALHEQMKFVQMGQILNALAHHWRQPLTALGLNIQDISETWHLGEMTGEYVDSVTASSMDIIMGMSATIDTFRSFFLPARAEHATDITQILREIHTLIVPQTEAEGITLHATCLCEQGACNLFTPAFHCRSPEKHPVVYGFGSDIKQVVVSLLNNSREAINRTHPGVGSISISIVVSDDTLHLRLSDDGGGIPSKTLGNIFTPFYTTTPDTNTGMGLTFAKSLVENRMHGTLSIMNDSFGATATLVLPRKHPAAVPCDPA